MLYVNCNIDSEIPKASKHVFVFQKGRTPNPGIIHTLVREKEKLRERLTQRHTERYRHIERKRDRERQKDNERWS